MAKAVRCLECAKVYDDLEAIEDLRGNDSICLACNTTIEVSDWDRVLASYDEDEEDLDDLDEDDIEESLDNDFGGWDEDLDDDDLGSAVGDDGEAGEADTDEDLDDDD